MSITVSVEDVDGIDNWSQWIAENIDETTAVEDDFGLLNIASYLEKDDAVRTYWRGAAMETEGDVSAAIALYKKAYRLWPALDSSTYGGLPRAVREEAISSGCPSRLLDVINVAEARASHVMMAPALLSLQDIKDIESVRSTISITESSLANNPQNATHTCKAATFMNNPPDYPLRHSAPHVVGKLIHFAKNAWEQSNWTGTSDCPGPLYAVSGGMASLSVRVIERWEYTAGGGLVDPEHYDVDSILTIVALLSEARDYEGGEFRTNESDDSQLVHAMNQGDAICFLSHKYHNITPLTSGIRRSLVIELWQGGVGHSGR